MFRGTHTNGIPENQGFGPENQGFGPFDAKNSGHFWLAKLQGGFNMLQLISVDSDHLAASSKDMGMLGHH